MACSIRASSGSSAAKACMPNSAVISMKMNLFIDLSPIWLFFTADRDIESFSEGHADAYAGDGGNDNHHALRLRQSLQGRNEPDGHATANPVQIQNFSIGVAL